MRPRFLIPTVVCAVSLSACGHSSSSTAASNSSAVRASNIAAVARQNTSSVSGGASSTAAPPHKGHAGVTPATHTPPLVDAAGNPIVPAAAKARTDAGAVAFTKYYIALLDYLDQHPDPRIGRSVDAEDCEACDEMNAVLKEHQRKGIYFVGTHTALISLKSQFSPDRNQVIVSFRQSKVPCTRIDGPGKVVSLGAAKFDTRLLLLWEKGGWKVGNMGSDPA